MLSARKLERLTERLQADATAGQAPDAVLVERYYVLAGFMAALACELYKYEYGRLPASAAELEAEEYFNTWPGDPLAQWQSLPLLTAQPQSGQAAIVLHAAPYSLAFTLRAYGGGPVPLLDYASPAATWYETEALLYGRDYLAHEQQLSANYPDRMLWPHSGIAAPAATP